MNNLPAVNGSTQPDILPGNTLAHYAANISQALQFSAVLYKSGIVPSHFKNAEAVYTAIIFGQEIGLSPVQSINTIYVIGGKPAIDSHGIAALILANGGEILEIESNEKACELCVTRPGKKDKTHRFTIENAKTAELLKNDNYRKYPQQMLYARCLTFLAHKQYEDKLKGFRSKEELEGVLDVTPSSSAVNDLNDSLLGKKPEAEGQEAPKPKKEIPLKDRLWSLMVALGDKHSITITRVEKWKGKTLESFTYDDFKELYAKLEDLDSGVAPEDAFNDREEP